MNRILAKLAFAAAALAVSATAGAAVSFSFTSGSYAAKADFDVIAGQLQVTLTNTSGADVVDPVGVLTGIFFNYTGSALSKVSANVDALSAINFCSAATSCTTSGTNVGGEWAYKAGTTIASGVGTRTHGISSTGLGVFGSAELFGGPNLQGPVAPDGLQFGITSAGDNLANGNAAVTGGFALIKNKVTFVLGGATMADLAKIKDVVFQYGTSLSEPAFLCTTCPGSGGGGSAPEPAGLALAGLALGAAALSTRRRRSAAALR